MRYLFNYREFPIIPLPNVHMLNSVRTQYASTQTSLPILKLSATNFFKSSFSVAYDTNIS